MDDVKQREIFSKNLNRLISDSGKKQKEIADAIGVSPQTFNTWCQAIAYPRMGKIQALADYFGIEKSDLIDERKPYYLNDETASMAQKLYDNENLRLLFDAAEDADPEDLKITADLLQSLKRKENHEDDD